MRGYIFNTTWAASGRVEHLQFPPLSQIFSRSHLAHTCGHRPGLIHGSHHASVEVTVRSSTSSSHRAHTSKIAQMARLPIRGTLSSQPSGAVASPWRHEPFLVRFSGWFRGVPSALGGFVAVSRRLRLLEEVGEESHRVGGLRLRNGQWSGQWNGDWNGPCNGPCNGQRTARDAQQAFVWATP